MEFFDNFNMIFAEVFSLAFRIFPFILCLTVFLLVVLYLIGLLARWIRWRFIWHYKDDHEE